MTTPFQPAAFEPPSIYEAPGLMLNQLLDNEATLATIHHDLFEQNKLSPAERDGYTQRIKASLGDHNLTNAVVDIVTNPLVWLMFISQPVARSEALAGKSLYAGSAKIGPYVREHSSVFAPFKSLHADLAGSGLGEPLRQLGQRATKYRQDEANALAPVIAKFRAANGFNPLDPSSAKTLAHKAALEEFNLALETRVRRFGEDVVEQRASIVKNEAGERVVVPMDTLIKARVNGYGRADRVIKATPHGQEFIDAIYHPETGLYRKAHANLFETEGKIDPRKVSNFMDGMKARTNRNRLAPEWLDSASPDEWSVGMGALDQLYGPEVTHAISTGLLSEADFLKLVEQTHAMNLTHGNYVPRNLPHFHNPQNWVFADMRGNFNTGGYGVPRSGEPVFHPEDLSRFRQMGGTEALEQEIEAGKSVLADTKQGAVLQRLNHAESLKKYRHRWSMDAALHIDRPDEALVDSVRLSMGDKKFKALYKSRAGGYLNTMDLLETGHHGMTDRTTAQTLRNVWAPAVTQSIHTQAGFTAAMQAKTRQQMLHMYNQPWFQSLRSWNKPASNFVDAFERIAKAPTTASGARSAENWMAKWLYRSHLGLNTAAVMLNMTQPWLHAHGYLGTQAILHGYGQMFKEMGAYTSERWNLGRNMTDAQHGALLKKVFRHANFDGEDLLGLTRGPFDAIDRELFSEGHRSVLEKIGDAMLVPFQYAEWGNRVATAHATEFAATRRGLNQGNRMRSEIARMVMTTQFGGGPENTSRMFLNPESIGSNPLIRQFGSFPWRSFEETFAGPGRLGQGKRYSRLGNKELPGPAFMWDGLRNLGASAIAYEVGKNMLGVDPLRGGIIDASNPLSQRAQGGDNPLQLPPAAQIPWDLYRAAAGGDADLYATVLPRLLPGGLALSKAMGVMPRMPSPSYLAGLPGALQKRYADWGHTTPDGMVPVFQGDGSLTEYRSPTALVLEGLGLDMGAHKNGADIDAYLAKNREEILGYRQRAMSKMLANDIPGATAVQSEFQKRFGVPLTISQTQIKAAIRQREVPRSERMLDSMPPEVRAQYQQIVATRARNQGLEKTALIEAETSRKRSEMVKRPETVELDPATLQRLKEMADEADKAKKIRAMAFTPFKSFRVNDPYSGQPLQAPPAGGS